MKTILLKEGNLVNRGYIKEGDLLIRRGRIEKVGGSINNKADIEIACTGKLVMPGIIDDQVHFREPGLTHKADIFSESRAAVAGGVTSYMEMPNTKPPAVTRVLLEEKYESASRNSIANYSFFMGASNDNHDEVLQTDPKTVCGIKIFMGSSTGNMLVDNPVTLEVLFANSPLLIATHCEDETCIKSMEALYRNKYGEDVPIEKHALIRGAECCFLSSEMAVNLAKKHNTRLHILHISTKSELDLFTNTIPLSQKSITSEVCVHHLHFNSDDYQKKGTLIKCNPSIKDRINQEALFKALLDDRLDVIATDHAPHTFDEKSSTYFKAPSGIPLVQHTLNVMLGFYKMGMISLEKIVEKMCHAPAICFKVEDRGFLDEGCWADIAIVDTDQVWDVTKDNILYKCGWSPFEGETVTGKVESTIISGHLAFHQGIFNDELKGKRLTFNN